MNPEEIKELASRLKQYEEISALLLFGTGTNAPGDVAVLLDLSKANEQSEELRWKYTAALGSFSRPLNIIILNSASPFLKYQIMTSARLVFDRNRRLRSDFTEKVFTDYLEMRYREDTFCGAAANRCGEEVTMYMPRSGT
jgi:hypothetical protein